MESACQAEIGLLMKGYKQGSVANEYLPLWRKSVQEAAEAGTLASEIEGNDTRDFFQCPQLPSRGLPGTQRDHHCSQQHQAG